MNILKKKRVKKVFFIEIYFTLFVYAEYLNILLLPSYLSIF